MRIVLLPVVFLTLLSSVASARDPLFTGGENWVLTYDKDDIKIYTKHLKGQAVKAVKSVTKIKTNLESVATAITDADSLSSWFPYLKSSELLRAPNHEGESYTYIISSLPWPIKNRDILYKNKISYNENKTAIYFYSNVVMDEKLKAKNGNLVRVPASEALWRAKVLDEKTVEVELYAHADPGGSIPKWFTNLVVIQAPKKSLNNLRSYLESLDPSKEEPFDSLKVFGEEVIL